MKLVRDKIDKVFGDDKQPVFIKAKENKRKDLLTQKLLEEVAELITAPDRDNAIKEAADVVEVVTAIAMTHDITFLEIVSEMIVKNNERGGFNDLLCLDFEQVTKPPMDVYRGLGDSYGVFNGPTYSG